MKKKPITDGLEILESMFLKDDPELREMVQHERRKMRIAEQLYKLRKAEGLTQSEVACRIRTTTSVISRIENADYDGHNLSTVERFCQALGYEFHAEFKPKLAFSWTDGNLQSRTECSIATKSRESVWIDFSFPRHATAQGPAGEESLELAA